MNKPFISSMKKVCFKCTPKLSRELLLLFLVATIDMKTGIKVFRRHVFIAFVLYLR